MSQHNTASNFIGLSLTFIAIASLLFSGALFFNAGFLTNLINVSETARYGIAGGGIAFGLLCTLGSASAFATPSDNIINNQEENTKTIKTEIKKNQSLDTETNLLSSDQEAKTFAQKETEKSLNKENTPPSRHN